MENKNYKIDMPTHVLLLLFVFGIYHFIWIYKTTEYTNFLSGKEERNPVGQLLLCMFVPFYIIFWYSKTAELMDNYLTFDDSNFKTLVVVFSIFLTFVSSIIIQQKINSAVENAPNIQTGRIAETSACSKDIYIVMEIKKYKELLDMQAITKEEFDEKKKQLLNL